MNKKMHWISKWLLKESKNIKNVKHFLCIVIYDSICWKEKKEFPGAYNMRQKVMHTNFLRGTSSSGSMPKIEIDSQLVGEIRLDLDPLLRNYRSFSMLFLQCWGLTKSFLNLMD